MDEHAILGSILQEDIITSLFLFLLQICSPNNSKYILELRENGLNYALELKDLGVNHDVLLSSSATLDNLLHSLGVGFPSCNVETITFTPQGDCKNLR